MLTTRICTHLRGACACCDADTILAAIHGCRITTSSATSAAATSFRARGEPRPATIQCSNKPNTVTDAQWGQEIIAYWSISRGTHAHNIFWSWLSAELWGKYTTNLICMYFYSHNQGGNASIIFNNRRDCCVECHFDGHYHYCSSNPRKWVAFYATCVCVRVCVRVYQSQKPLIAHQHSEHMHNLQHNVHARKQNVYYFHHPTLVTNHQSIASTVGTVVSKSKWKVDLKPTWIIQFLNISKPGDPSIQRKSMHADLTH